MKNFVCLIMASLIVSGCVGFDMPPRIFDKKPFTLLRGSEQIGRDQMANRLLVSKKVFPLEGKYGNEVLTFLGQPQQIQVLQPGISEDWLYVYFNAEPKVDRLDSEQGSFLVRLYQDKVIDVVRS